MEFFTFEMLFMFWLACSLIPAIVASKRGRNGVEWFIIGMLISPVIATIVVVAMKDLSKKLCEACGEQIPVAAHVCPFCKAKDVSETPPYEFTPDNLDRKCPSCAEHIKLEALVCRFCGHKFELADVEAASQEAKSDFEEELKATHRTKDDVERDKLSRGLCPNCDAYLAWVDDRQHNVRTCEVCKAQYPLSIQTDDIHKLASGLA